MGTRAEPMLAAALRAILAISGRFLGRPRPDGAPGAAFRNGAHLRGMRPGLERTIFRGAFFHRQREPFGLLPLAAHVSAGRFGAGAARGARRRFPSQGSFAGSVSGGVDASSSRRLAGGSFRAGPSRSSGRRGGRRSFRQSCPANSSGISFPQTIVLVLPRQKARRTHAQSFLIQTPLNPNAVRPKAHSIKLPISQRSSIQK